MTIDDKIRDEILKYNVNRKAEKISVLSPDKIDKQEYLTGGEIVHPDQSRIIQQAKFTFYALGKAFEKEMKTTENQWGKQIKAIQEHEKQLIESNSLIKNLTTFKTKRNI